MTGLLLAAAAAVLQLPLTVAGTGAALAWGPRLALRHRPPPGLAWWMAHVRQAGFAQHGGAVHVDQAAHIALGLIPAAAILATL